MGIRSLILLSSYLLSDGGISAKGKESWTIYFRNKDKTVIQEFQKQLRECTGREGYTTKRKDGSIFVKIHSKKLGTKLFQLSGSYRTKPCTRHPICQHLKGKRSSHREPTINFDGVGYPPANLPKEIFKDTKLARNFLRIYATCDGGVSVVPAKNSKGSQFLVRRVFIAVEHPILKKELVEVLKILRYSPLEYKGQIRLTKKEDILKFSKEIAFIKNARISKDSKYLNGHTKNKILNMIVNSYDHPHILLGFLLKTRPFFRLSQD